MQRTAIATTTAIHSAEVWNAKTKETASRRDSWEPIIPSQSLSKDTQHGSATFQKTTTTSGSGFHDQKTLWEQELYRYHPSGWLLVRVGSLIGFPYLMSLVGSHVWPRVVDAAHYWDVETSTIALPAIAIMSMTAFFTHNALYGLIYRYACPSKLFDQYRVDDKPWHWETDPEGWNQMLRNTMGLILFNFLGLTFPLMALNYYFYGTPLRLDVQSLPGGKEMLWQLLFCLVMEDFGFHHAHQLLHTKQFYWIHKIHHRYHAPIAVSAAYAHPLEYMFGNLLPSVLGPLLLQNRMHAWSFCIWLMFRASAAVENHSGYEFPWSMYQAIPFKAPTEYHDFHHNRNQGTYSGVLRLWDMIYGTNTHYFEWVNQGRPERRSRKTNKGTKKES